MNNATIPTADEIKVMLSDLFQIDETLFESGAPQEARWEVQAVIGKLSRARKDVAAIHSALAKGSTLGGFINAGIADVQKAVAAYHEYKANH